MISILAALAVSTLVGAPANHTPTRADVDSSTMTLVVVQNDRSVPVTVYEEDDFGDVTIGVVPARSTETMRIDQLVRESKAIRFFVTPRGQNEEATDFVDVDPGEHISLVVPERGR